MECNELMMSHWFDHHEHMMMMMTKLMKMMITTMMTTNLGMTTFEGMMMNRVELMMMMTKLTDLMDHWIDLSLVMKLHSL